MFLTWWLLGLIASSIYQAGVFSINVFPLDQVEKLNYRLAKVNLGSKFYQAQIAETSQQMSLGLGYRQRLEDKQAMLFVFPRPSQPQFWMKGMQFNLDLIWINQIGEIIGVNENVSFKDQKSLYSAPGKILYVLEVPAGDYALAGRPDQVYIDWSK